MPATRRPPTRPEGRCRHRVPAERVRFPYFRCVDPPPPDPTAPNGPATVRPGRTQQHRSIDPPPPHRTRQHRSIDPPPPHQTAPKHHSIDPPSPHPTALIRRGDARPPAALFAAPHTTTRSSSDPTARRLVHHEAAGTERRDTGCFGSLFGRLTPRLPTTGMAATGRKTHGAGRRTETLRVANATTLRTSAPSPSRPPVTTTPGPRCRTPPVRREAHGASR